MDLIYGVFVSPFFVENYIDIYWNQGMGYCHFYEYIFSFHDLFVPLVLVLVSTYISLKFSGINVVICSSKNEFLKRNIFRGQSSVEVQEADLSRLIRNRLDLLSLPGNSCFCSLNDMDG